MNELERFKTEIEPYRDGWKSVELRTICFQAYGTWINLATRIYLSPQPVEAITSPLPLPTFPGFATLQDFRGIDALDDLLSELSAATLQVSDKVIHFAKIDNAAVRLAPLSFTLQVNHRSDPRCPPGLLFTSIVMRGWGESLHNLLHSHPQAPGRTLWTGSSDRLTARTTVSTTSSPLFSTLPGSLGDTPSSPLSRRS